MQKQYQALFPHADATLCANTQVKNLWLSLIPCQAACYGKTKQAYAPCMIVQESRLFSGEQRKFSMQVLVIVASLLLSCIKTGVSFMLKNHK